HRRADAGRHEAQEVEAGIRRQCAVWFPASCRQAPRGAGAGRAGHPGADSPAPEDWQIAAGDRRPVEPAEDQDASGKSLEARICRTAPEGGVTWTSTASFRT